MNYRTWIPIFVVCLAGGTPFSSAAHGDEWPGWMGPRRDGVYRESGIIDEIPDSGLKVKWRQPVAGGYAGPAVADGRVFVFDFQEQGGDAFNNPNQRAEVSGRERLTALDAATGEPLWKHSYDCTYTISYPAGPRCTPTVDGDRVYTLGAQGHLRCLRTSDGELVWQRNLPADFSVDVPMWGFASHPLVDGDLLYTMVGGEGQGIVAFDKHTGEVQWKALDAETGYCPPSIIRAGGQRQLIVFHPAAVASLDPADGSKYWSVPISPSFEMSVTRPMVCGDSMYASAIRNEAVMLKLDSDEPAVEVQWRGQGPGDAVHCNNSTPIFTKDAIYGTDCNRGSLIAVDTETGERMWQTVQATRPEETRRVSHGTAFLTRLRETDRYLIFSEVGDLLIASLTPSGFQSHGRFHVLEPTGEAFGRNVVWSHPAYAGRTGYFRNDQEIVAVDLSSNSDPQGTP